MDRAAKSGAIVSSLFPKNVRDRLLEEAGPTPSKKRRRVSLLQTVTHGNDGGSQELTPQDNATASRQSASTGSSSRGGLSTSRRLSTFLSSESSESEVSRVDDSMPNKKAPLEDSTPIADLFDEATVFFADLTGFTRWSSGRKPTDVFGLLEKIYGKIKRYSLGRDLLRNSYSPSNRIALRYLIGAFDKVAVRFKVFKVETVRTAGRHYLYSFGL